MVTKVALAAAIAATAILVFAAATYYYDNYPSTSPNSSQPQSPTDQADLNWAGYVATYSISDPKPLVTQVSGSWVVPQIQSSQNDTFSAVWIGIGGFFGHTLIQTGTEQDCINGVIYYSAWFELLPAEAVTITTIDISPGDTIKASVSLTIPSENVWSISISDLSTGQSFRQEFFYDSSRLSAEWTVERPDVNNALSEIADFGSVTLSNCTATIDNEVAAIGHFPSIRLFMHDMEGTRLADASNLSNDGASFTVRYLTAQ